MWGYEGEELEDIEATIAHVKTSDPDVFFTTVAYPIKGTPYYENNVKFSCATETLAPVLGSRAIASRPALSGILRLRGSPASKRSATCTPAARGQQ